MQIRTSRYLQTVVALAWIQLVGVIFRFSVKEFDISWGLVLFPLWLAITYTFIVLAKIIVAMAHTLEANEKMRDELEDLGYGDEDVDINNGEDEDVQDV